MKNHDHHCPWQSNWKSPVALGIFLLTVALAGAIVLYTLLNVGVSLIGVLHSSDDSQFMQQQAIPGQGINTSTSGGPGSATQ